MTLVIADPVFLLHAPPQGHPERAERLQAIDEVLGEPAFAEVSHAKAKPATRAQIEAAHDQAYVAQLYGWAEEKKNAMIDADTWFGGRSLEAALHAAGAAVQAVDAVMSGASRNAFCAVRPPGHHVEHDRAMGFCLINNAAVAARHLQKAHGLKKIAIVDFDVHHGNGTQDIFEKDASVFYASSHQSPCYPGTGQESERGVGNIFNATLPPGSGSASFRTAYQDCILTALDGFAPEFLILSAGFDAHWRDPLAQLELEEEDFAWVTEKLCQLASRHCSSRVISILEGGYDLEGLKLSVRAHLQALTAA